MNIVTGINENLIMSGHWVAFSFTTNIKVNFLSDGNKILAVNI